MHKRLSLLVVCLFIFASAFSMTEAERKAYLEWMQTSMPEVKEFNEWQKSSGELPPDFDAMPRSNLLPDPLKFYDGTAVGPLTSDWEKRRTEIKQLYEKYMLGTFPPKPTIDKVEILDETRGEGYYIRNVKVWFGPESKGSVRIRITVPTGNKDAKYPVLLSPDLSGWGNILLRRGYISAGFAGNDFMDDAAALKDLYPSYDFATLPRRAWLAQIVIDYLISVPEVNKDQIAIYGYSRDGKMATIATAFDERIAAVLAGSTGVGGVVPWRHAGERGGGEGIESTTRMFPGWFVPRLRFFAGKEDRLPVDANLFLALIAPRAALLEWGLSDQVANGWGMEQAYQSAQKVYERLGAPKRLSLMHVPGFHGSNDQEACIDFLDVQFNRTTSPWKYDFIFSWNYEVWKKISGENINPASYPAYNPKAPIASSLKDWNQKKEGLRAAVIEMLGETPLQMKSTTPSFNFSFGGGMRNPGPTEIAKGTSGNPGQLAPDVPSWVISQGSQEYGWLSPEKEQVTSKRIRFGTDNVTGDLYYLSDTPEGTKRPTVIWLHGYHYPLGYMWVYRRDLHPILALAKAGYAVLAFDQSGHGMRYKEYAPFYNRFPHWSRLGKMVNDVHGAVDALYKDNMVDTARISVLGYTMGGTVGLYAAALDPRIKNVVSVCGFTPMRTDKSSSGTSGMTRYSHVYGMLPRLSFFEGQEERLPYDYEDLIALIAPRGVLVVQNTMDRDANPEAVKKAVEKASAVYKLLKAPANQLTIQEPYDYARFTTTIQDDCILWLNNHNNINQ